MGQQGREILFRGKRLDNGKWVTGFYFLHKDGRVEIWQPGEFILAGRDLGGCWYFVDPATLGQYTGLTDKNGVKIFIGDIVKFKHGGEFDEREIYFRNYAVEFINTFVTYGVRLRNRGIHFPFKQATAMMHDAVVIGNIYDNPELLEDGGKV